MNEVRVTSIDIPFGQLVWLMTKVFLAALPAGILAFLIVYMPLAMLAGIGEAP